MLKFKTNIKCAGCIAAVTPKMNEQVGENKWQVDVQVPDKILTVNATVQATDIISALDKLGYKAELMG